MDDGILREQIRSYRERSGAFHVSILGDDDASVGPHVEEFRALSQMSARVTRCGRALELACDTRIWTRQLLDVAHTMLAVDAPLERIELDRANGARVRYQIVDLFPWDPENPIDLAFAACWLTHVPAERLALMLTTLRRAVRPGGQLAIIHESDSPPARPAASDHTVSQWSLGDLGRATAMPRHIRLEPHPTQGELEAHHRWVRGPVECSRRAAMGSHEHFLSLLTHGLTATAVADVTGSYTFWIGAIVRRATSATVRTACATDADAQVPPRRCSTRRSVRRFGGRWRDPCPRATLGTGGARRGGPSDDSRSAYADRPAGDRDDRWAPTGGSPGRAKCAPTRRPGLSS